MRVGLRQLLPVSNQDRVAGSRRPCAKEINHAGHKVASERIAAAIAMMRRYNRIRLPCFKDLLMQARKQAKFDLIIFDEMGSRKLTAIAAQDLCEILEERSVQKWVVFTSQLPLDHWSEVIADTVISYAIFDRIPHSALTIEVTGESYRGVKARKLAGAKSSRNTRRLRPRR